MIKIRNIAFGEIKWSWSLARQIEYFKNFEYHNDDRVYNLYPDEIGGKNITWIGCRKNDVFMFSIPVHDESMISKISFEDGFINYWQTWSQDEYYEEETGEQYDAFRKAIEVSQDERFVALCKKVLECFTSPEQVSDVLKMRNLILDMATEPNGYGYDLRE